jgi:glycosyltransferase involved in cell wall biosynthesis
MPNKPTISVVIPVYNGAKFLSQAIRSVLDQTWRNFELIIVDNASDDDSLKVARNYRDSRVLIYAEKNHLPIYANFNRAAGYARGKYIKFLCADDVLLPASLETLLKIMMNEPKIGLATSKRVAIDANGNHKGLLHLEHRGGRIPGGEALKLVTKLNNYIGEPSCVLLKKDVFTALGGFDSRFCQLGDLHLWCRILAKHDLYYYQTPLSCYRIHSEQTTHKNLRNLKLWLREDRWIRKTLRALGYRKNWFYRLLIAARTRPIARRPSLEIKKP